MAPDKLYKDYVVPLARKLTPREQSSTDYYRSLREKFHDGPYYSVLDVSSSNAKKGSAARANFDPFHGMPSYAGRYQKKRRTIPKIAGVREYGKPFLFPGNFSSSIISAFSIDEMFFVQKRDFSRAISGRQFDLTSDRMLPSKDSNLP